MLLFEKDKAEAVLIFKARELRVYETETREAQERKSRRENLPSGG